MRSLHLSRTFIWRLKAVALVLALHTAFDVEAQVQPQPQSVPAASSSAPWGQALARFLEDAAQRHPALAQAQAGVQAAQSQVSGARWQYGPSTSFSRDTVQGGATNTLRVDQPIWSAGYLGAGLAAARAAQRGSEQDVLATRLSLKTRLTNYWADWVKAGHRATLLEGLVKEHDDLLVMILRRAESGVATAADATLARARLNQVRAELAQARLQLAHVRGQLERQASMPVAEGLDHALDPGAPQGAGAQALPPAPTLDQLLAQVTQSPEMEKARSSVEVARQEVNRRRGQLFPTVSLRLENQTGSVRDQRVGLVVQMNFGAGLSSVDGLRAEQARLAAAMNAADAQEKELVDRYQQEFTRYGVAATSVAAARDTAAYTGQVLESYRRQFANGKRAWLDLLNMVRETHVSRQAQMDAEVEERAGLFRLQLLIDGTAVGAHQ